MADMGDYLEVYKRFFEDFAATVNPNDQLPVKVAGYYLSDNELVGEIVDWTLQYLNQKKCPSSLVAHITRIVIDEMRLLCKGHPNAFRTADNSYQPLKLMQAVTRKVDEVCLRYRDNGYMSTLPPPHPGLLISTCAIKNTRRCMEDRHVIIEDFHGVFNIEDNNPASYYAVFDGHAGSDAAVYSVCHLHQFLAESPYYPTDPVKALKDAFFRTDNLFIEKSIKEHLRSGTTAVCALLRPKEKKLYVAWLGDSQAILVSEGKAVQVVNPHKPDRQDERQRIEDMGGCVLFWGTWRVDGQLAVSRAIGDPDYKPYVTAEPDVVSVDLSGNEDFLVLACDGLWDFVREEEAVAAVYEQIRRKPDDLEAVSQRLVQLSKQQGSTDNISVIIVFLTAPSRLASRPLNESRQWPSLRNGPQYQAVSSMENETSTNPFTNGASEEVSCQKGGLLLDLGADSDGNTFKQNGKKTPELFFLGCPPNGKVTEDDDLGPETDVDAVDDVQLSPCNNNPFESNTGIQPKLLDFDSISEPRQETPTPPADEVTGVASLVPDNVAESGEESEDEWNYYRVEPTGSVSETDTKQEQQATIPISEKPAEKEVPEDTSESAENMESQLNPNAAEFIPSPTQHRSIEQFLQSNTSNVDAALLSPLASKIEEGAPKVPFASESFNTISPNEDLPDLLNGQKPDMCHHEEVSDGLPEQSDGSPATVSDAAAFEQTQHVITSAFEELDQSPLDTPVSGDILCSSGDPIQELGESSIVLPEPNDSVEAASNPFVTESHNLNQPGDDFNPEECKILADVVSTDPFSIKDSVPEVPTSPVESEPSVHENDQFEIESSIMSVPNLTQEPSAFLDKMTSSLLVADKAREPIHISFELQKDIAPEMESQPELVKLNGDDNGLGFEVQESVLEETNIEPSETADINLIPLDSPVEKGIGVCSETVDPIISEFNDLNLQSPENEGSIQEDIGTFISNKIGYNAQEHSDVLVPDFDFVGVLEDAHKADMTTTNTEPSPPLTPTSITIVENSIPNVQSEMEVEKLPEVDVMENPLAAAVEKLPEVDVMENPLAAAVEKLSEVNMAADSLEGMAVEKQPEIGVAEQPEIGVAEQPEIGVAEQPETGVAEQREIGVAAEPSEVMAVTAAATVVAAAAAVAAGMDITENKSEVVSMDKKEDIVVAESKKESAVAMKKVGTAIKAKKPLSEKVKPPIKATGSQKPVPSKTVKSVPTSPTKPGSIPAVTKTAPKKFPASAPLNRPSKPPTPTAAVAAASPSSNRPKTNGIPAKSSPGLLKPKLSSVASSGSPVIDASRPTAKRPESASNKIGTGTTVASKTRPISAPASTPKTMKLAASKTLPTTVRPSTASANGSVAKPKLSSLSARPKSVTQSKVASVKEGKESVNKQISSSRTSAKPSSTSNVTRTVSQSTTRKVESKSVANSSSTLKTTTTALKTTSKVGIKKSAVTSVTSSSSPKTKVSATSQNQESIKEVTSVISNEVKSDHAIFENAEIAE